MIVLRLVCHVFQQRISLAAGGFLARFLRRAALPPRPQRPAPRIRSRGAARVRARPRHRDLRRVHLQSTGLSSPLCVLTQRLATGMIFRRDSFAAVFPTSVLCGASAILPAPPSGGPERATIRSRSTICFTRPAHTCHPQVSLR